MSTRNYTYHNVQYNGDGGFDGFGPFGNGLIDDGSDANGATAPNDGLDRRLSFTTQDADSGTFQEVVPLASTVSSVVVHYRYAQSGSAEFRTYIKNGASRFNGSFGAPATYPSFTAVDITWTTDANSNPWTVANFFATRYGTRVDPISNGATLYWSELSQTINFTLPAPTATTNAATNVTLSTATLNGTLNPGGTTSFYPVSYKFQWGLTTAYGNETAVVGGNYGSSSTAVFANITGLTGATQYHYRLVAYNDDVTTNGADQTFTTSSSETVLMVL